MPPYLRVQRYLRVDQVIIQLVNEHDQPSTAFGDFLILYSDGNAILLYVLIRCFVDGSENTTLRELGVSVIELLQPCISSSFILVAPLLSLARDPGSAGGEGTITWSEGAERYPNVFSRSTSRPGSMVLA